MARPRPTHVSLEAQRCGHGAVAIAPVSIGRNVADGAPATRSRRRDLMENETGIGAHRCQPVDRDRRFFEISLLRGVATAPQTRSRQCHPNGTTDSNMASTTAVEFNSTIDIAE